MFAWQEPGQVRFAEAKGLGDAVRQTQLRETIYGDGVLWSTPDPSDSAAAAPKA